MPVLRRTQPSAAKQAAEKGGFEKRSSPQRLKPDSLHSSYVRPEGRTLQTKRVFPQPVKPDSLGSSYAYGLKAVPFREASFSAAC